MIEQLTNSPRCDVDKEREVAPTRGEFEPKDFEGLKIEEFHVTNKRGERLTGEIIYCDEPIDRVCIVCHGWTSNRMGAYKYAKALLDNNFHVVVYDHTNCGNSEGNYTSMGGYESDDLSDVIDFVKDKFGEESKLLTYGESMGAVTVLMNMTKDSRMDAVVADCPFASLEDETAYILTKKNKLPKYPIFWIANLIYKHRTGMNFSDVSPYQAILDADGVKDIPLLILHGAEDDFILPSQSKKIKSVKQGYVELHYIKGANHAVSIMTEPEVYRGYLKNFLEKHII
jgi:alpha-beta hydrolase superfamily lysophospholipase